jgi:hypothetical protein
VVYPYSQTPTDNSAIAASLADFSLIVKGAQPPPSGVLAVGGIPSTRTYFRFNLPSSLVDSAIVIRATLLLTQVPSTSPGAADTMQIRPVLVVARPLISDVERAAQVTDTLIVPLAPFVTHPQDAGVKAIEIAPVFKIWALQKETDLPRAIVLWSTGEGSSPKQALFSSSSAPVDSRPKLRISYTPRTRIGTP